MSNKMNKILLILVLICLTAELAAFAPRERDFTSQYQYRLYKSWLARENTARDLPAKITSQYVKRTLEFEKSGQAEVVYIWDNWQIISQRENLSARMPFSAYDTELIIAGELLYRLNCRHRIFAEHYLQKMPLTITYQGLRSQFALDSLWVNYPQVRLPLQNLHPVINQDELVQLILQFDGGDELVIIFNDLSQFAHARIRLQEFENNYAKDALPSDFSRHLTDITYYYPPVSEKAEPVKPEETTVPETEAMVKKEIFLTKYEQRLIDWIEEHQDTSWGSEMINNKIPDISEFLQNEFKQHSLLKKNDTYNLIHAPFCGNLKADLYFEIKENGGWLIKATDDITITGKKVDVAGFEEYNLSDLEFYDIESIAPYIPQLLMSHRVMSSRLAGFILEPDIAETTLVLDGSSRRIYSLKSYRDLMFLLGHFWEDRTIYYNVADFHLVNGYIEFKGYLAAEETQSGKYDLAEIRYRLDDDYSIVLAMIVVFPDQTLLKDQGR